VSALIFEPRMTNRFELLHGGVHRSGANAELFLQFPHSYPVATFCQRVAEHSERQIANGWIEQSCFRRNEELAFGVAVTFVLAVTAIARLDLTCIVAAIDFGAPCFDG
jgi:hypothetical protein